MTQDDVYAAIKSGMETTPELAAKFGCKPRTIQTHITRLSDAGVIKQVGKENRYVRWTVAQPFLLGDVWKGIEQGKTFRGRRNDAWRGRLKG